MGCTRASRGCCACESSSSQSSSLLMPHRENDITDVLDETFSVTEDRFGETVVIELMPGGAAHEVTEGNKEQYVALAVTHRITERIAEQLRALMEGLGDVLPLELLREFDEHEMDILIGGMTEIDMDDWMRFTEYCGYE